MQIESPEVQYWIHVYATVFSVLILTTSITLTFFIKDLCKRILSVIFLNAIISILLNWFVFSKSYMGYIQQDFFYSFILLGFDNNIFFGYYYSLIAMCSFLALIMVMVRKKTFKTNLL